MQGSLTADEAAFQKRVVDLAHRAGWRTNHTYRARTGKGGWRTTTTGTGFPDLTIIKPGRLVMLELKMPGNDATPEQREWLDLFDSVPGCVARVVWPADWEWIVTTLTARR